jgi:ORF6N domain
MTTTTTSSTLLPRIEGRIQVLRGLKVMIDADLAELYGVPTKALNQAVKRNASRFPIDFMFQLDAAEKTEVVTNCDHLAKLKLFEDSERGPDEDLRLQFEAMGQLTPEEKNVAPAALEGLLLKHAAHRFTTASNA